MGLRVPLATMSLALSLAFFSCAKASFKGGSIGATDPNAANANGSGPNSTDPNGQRRPKNGTDISDIGMDGKFDPNDRNDPDNPNSPLNPYNPEFKPKGPPGGAANPCTKGDKIDFSWSGAEKECIVDKGKTFHFDHNVCLQLNVSKFDCSWNTLVTKLQAEGIEITPKIKASMSNGSKLITCGEVRQDEKNRIIVQWIRAEDISTIESCQAGGNSNPNVTTGCYTHYLKKAQPEKAKSEDEERQRVYQCLDEA